MSSHHAAPLTRTNIWIYACLSLPISMIGYPLGIWVPRLYASDMGLNLGLIGAVLAATALYDAFTDPAMGLVTDRVRTPFGRRRPWILLGVPLFSLGVWMLLNPTHGVTAVYLALWFIVMRSASTIINLPYATWGAELSAEYHNRTRISSARERFSMIGLIGGSMIPLAVEWAAAIQKDPAFLLTKFAWLTSIGPQVMHGISTHFLTFARWWGITEATPAAVLGQYSFVLLVLLPVAALLVVCFVPEAPPLPRQTQLGIGKSAQMMMRNKLLLRIIVIEVLVAGGENFRNALSLFFMQDYIGVHYAGEMYVVYFSVGLLAISFWDYVARKGGKHLSLAGAMIFVGAVSIWIFTLHYGDVTAFYVLFALKGFCFGAFAYLPRAMIADVVDVDTLRSGDARPGSYFAILGVMTKVASAFGLLSLPLLGLVGYNAKVAGQHLNGPHELLWLGVLYAIVPTVLFGIACYLAWTWPLTGPRHARLQALLERKQARLRARHAIAGAGG